MDNSSSGHKMPTLITRTSLFVDNLPASIEEDVLRNIFKDFGMTRVVIDKCEHHNGNVRQTCKAQVDFSKIEDAEKALATLHLHPLPNTNPAVLLSLTIAQEYTPLTSFFSGNPRLVKRLPPDFNGAKLYDLIRPFGRLASARVDAELGGIVQFWTEADAQTAEHAIRQTFVRDLQITLQAYDPRNLYCANLSPEINEGNLRTRFGQFGSIISTRIFLSKKGHGPGYAFVSFHSPEAASNAIQGLHGTKMGSGLITVRYHEPKAKVAHKTTVTEPSKGGGTGGDIDDGNADGTETLGQTSAKTTTGREQDDSSAPKNEAEINNLRTQLAELDSERLKERKENQFKLDDVNTQLEGQRKEIKDLLKHSEAERDSLRSECDQWRRKCVMAESRCKILELEADRPIWEQAKKMREKKEQEEQEKAEAKRRQAEIEESQRKMREFLAEERRQAMEAKKRREREEAERRAREKEERARLERERAAEQARRKAWQRATVLERTRCRQRDACMWGPGERWTKKLAVDRFIVLSDEFDKIRFSEAQPLTFEAIPWPVCKKPAKLLIEDIIWSEVECFFVFAKSSYTEVEFKKFVEKAHRMFHPDKWSARRVFQTVMDDDLRKLLEDAVNIVSQAVTPLWRTSKGYD